MDFFYKDLEYNFFFAIITFDLSVISSSIESVFLYIGFLLRNSFKLFELSFDFLVSFFDSSLVEFFWINAFNVFNEEAKICMFYLG